MLEGKGDSFQTKQSRRQGDDNINNRCWIFTVHSILSKIQKHRFKGGGGVENESDSQLHLSPSPISCASWGEGGGGGKQHNTTGREKRFPKQQSQPYLNFPGRWGTRKLSQSHQCDCPVLEAEKGTPRECWGTRGGSPAPPPPTHKESRKGLGSDHK